MSSPEGSAGFFPGDGLPDGFHAFNALPDFSEDLTPPIVTMSLEEAIERGLLPKANLTVGPMVVEGEVIEESPQAYFPAPSDLYPLTDGQGGDRVPTAYGGLIDAAVPEGGVDPGFQIATPVPNEPSKEHN